MDELKILWTQTALKQRNYIFKYWNKRNKSNTYSKKLNFLIKERTSLLKLQPDLGVKTNFKQTRVIHLSHYSIIYKLNKPNIIIVGFWDNRQNPKKLLDFLKQN